MKRVCINDGVEFEARRSTAKYCSTSCRTDYHYKQKYGVVGQWDAPTIDNIEAIKRDEAEGWVATLNWLSEWEPAYAAKFVEVENGYPKLHPEFSRLFGREVLGVRRLDWINAKIVPHEIVYDTEREEQERFYLKDG